MLFPFPLILSSCYSCTRQIAVRVFVMSGWLGTRDLQKIPRETGDWGPGEAGFAHNLGISP
jgi:hypothetical protein